MIGRVGSGAIGGRAGGDGMTLAAWRDEPMIPRAVGGHTWWRTHGHRTPVESPGEEDGGPAATRGGKRRTNSGAAEANAAATAFRRG